MHHKVILTMLLAATSFACLAGPELDGKYKASWDGNGKSFEAELVIDGNAGTWNAHAQNVRNPCVGREFPIAVNAHSDEIILIDLLGSKALQGCTDMLLKLKRSGPGVLVGRRINGQDSHKITLVKE